VGSSLFANSLDVVELEPFFVGSFAPQAPVGDTSLVGDEWRSRGAVGLAEALESAQPGISLVRKAGMSNDVVVRGLGGDDVSVTLDGRKIFCACSNRMDPPLSHATAENAQRVEIATGPFSLKRSGSLGGHINIVSAPIELGWHGDVTAGLGSFSQQQYSSWTSYAEDQWAVRVQFGYLSGDAYETGDGTRITELPGGTAAYLSEYVDGSAYEAWHVGGEFEWTFDEGLRLRFNVVRREDSDVFFPGLKMDADTTETTQVGFRLLQEEPVGMLEQWTADVYCNETEHLMTDSKRRSSQVGMGNTPRPAFVLNRGYFMRTDATARNWGATLDAETDAGAWGYWSFGGELGQREWDSDNTILNIDNAMLPDVLASSVGFYSQGRFEFESDWSIEAGLRLDWFDVNPRGDTSLLETRLGDADRYSAVEPGGTLSARYQFNETTAFFVGIGSVARSPNPQELYIQVNKPDQDMAGNPLLNPPEDWLGNPDLDAPRSTEVTAGLEFVTEDWNFRVRGFHSWLDDYIYPVALGTTPDTQSYANIDAQLYGLELSGGYQINDQWSLALGLAWQEGRKQSGIGNGNTVLAEIPPLRVQAALQYETDLTLLKFEMQASDNQNRVDTDLKEQDLGSWATASFYAQRKLGKHWTLACAVTNIFDENYALQNAQVRNPFSEFTVVDEPGRMLKASLSYSF
jgi:iron complex outermembrane receptor protein